jgi:hypothetical protein
MQSIWFAKWFDGAFRRGARGRVINLQKSAPIQQLIAAKTRI